VNGRTNPGRPDRPGLVPFVLDALAASYGVPTWQPRHDAVAELVLTILSQHTSDLNAERAFAELRRRLPSWLDVEEAEAGEVAAAIVSGGLALQKTPRIQGALRAIRREVGTHDLAFLVTRDPLAARDWLTALPGVGPKTASVVLLFSFGMPLMPVDTHVHRVMRRIGIIPPATSADRAHDASLLILPSDRVFEAHVNFITHGRRVCFARRPACHRCPVMPRCRHVDLAAP
jgi:endonuclease III